MRQGLGNINSTNRLRGTNQIGFSYFLEHPRIEFPLSEPDKIIYDNGGKIAITLYDNTDTRGVSENNAMRNIIDLFASQKPKANAAFFDEKRQLAIFGDFTTIINTLAGREIKSVDDLKAISGDEWYLLLMEKKTLIALFEGYEAAKTQRQLDLDQAGTRGTA